MISKVHGKAEKTFPKFSHVLETSFKKWYFKIWKNAVITKVTGHSAVSEFILNIIITLLF